VIHVDILIIRCLFLARRRLRPVAMIVPNPAAVKPRVLCSQSGEVVPLESVVRELLDRSCGDAICLCGPAAVPSRSRKTDTFPSTRASANLYRAASESLSHRALSIRDWQSLTDRRKKLDATARIDRVQRRRGQSADPHHAFLLHGGKSTHAPHRSLSRRRADIIGARYGMRVVRAQPSPPWWKCHHLRFGTHHW
jgi:hypothetical protein